MALSASLQLRQNQSLAMTPQLVQSIQLLQMTHVELIQFLHQEIEKNPLLEFSSADNDLNAITAHTDNSNQTDADSDRELSADDNLLPDDWYEDTSGVLADQLDISFDNTFDDDTITIKSDAPELIGDWKSMPSGSSGEAYDLDDFVAAKPSLYGHINQQIPFVIKDPSQRLIADRLLDLLEDTGYLTVGGVSDLSQEISRDQNEIEAVLIKLQSLDPAGIFARNLSECLAIQLEQNNRLDPAMRILVNNLDLLAKRDFATLKKLCSVDEEDLLDMLAEIKSLNPRPGAAFSHEFSESVVPDIIVKADGDGSWQIELNPETLPSVIVNEDYARKVSTRAKANDENNNFISECLQTAHWLTRSLDQRAKTMLKVGSEIIRQQEEFLQHGVDYLRPLNLRTVADAIKMHESTVSRVTTKKYMLTPRGLFELKYFFTTSIGSVEGTDNFSAEAVRHKIKSFIASENADSVLSDDDIVSELKKNGIDLARRTVAKYREGMNIPSSVQRRREKKAAAKKLSS